MANVIDDQQRFREIQTRVFANFDRSLIGNTLPPDDQALERNCLDYVLEQIKRDISLRLQKIETVCRFRISFGASEYAVLALQTFYDLFYSIDVEYQNDLAKRFNDYNNEKKKTNFPEKVSPESED